MRKLIIAATLLVIVSCNTFAQFTIGAKVGLNLAKEYAGIKALDEDKNFKPGLNAGVFGRYAISDKFDVQTEVIYSQQGYKSDIVLTDYDGSIMNPEFKGSSHYLNIPVLIKYYPLKRFYVETGPQIGFCIASDFTSGNDYVQNEIRKLNTDYNTVDFSLAGGVGFCIGYGLSVNVRYNHGFTKTLNQSSWKNRVVSFSLLYDLWSL